VREGISHEEISGLCAAWLDSDRAEEEEQELEALRVHEKTEALYRESLAITKSEPRKRCEHRRQEAALRRWRDGTAGF
jgi:hypothetical protein